MDSNTLIGVGGTVLGTVIGFCLSTLQTRWRQRKTNSNVRAVIAMELDHDLKMLNEIYLHASNPRFQSDTVFDRAMAEAQLHASLGETPFPFWSHKIWESQMQAAPAALSEEKLRVVHRIHTLLEAITFIKTGCSKSTTYEGLGKTLRPILEEILNTGNPLSMDENEMESTKLIRKKKEHLQLDEKPMLYDPMIEVSDKKAKGE